MGRTAGQSRRSGAGAASPQPRAGQGRARPGGAAHKPVTGPNYARRRLLVLLAAVGLVAAVVLGIVATGFWVRDTIRQQDADKAASAAGTVYPQPVACVITDLDTSVDMPVQAAVGAGVTADVTVTNRGSQACLVDVGGKSLGLVVVSGNATLLDSTVCPAEPTSRRLLLSAGETAQVQVAWNGMVATSECAAVPRAGGNVVAGAAGTADTDGEAGTAGSGQDGQDAQASASASPTAPSDQSDQDSQGEETGQGSQAAGTASQADDVGSQAGAAAGQAAAVAGSAAQPPAQSSADGTDPHPTEVTIAPKGGYARSGTYTLWLTLGGELIGTERPLVIGQG